MRHGKLVTEEANIAKTEREQNARLWRAAQEAVANGEHFETEAELKSLTLEEVAKRLKEIVHPVDNPHRSRYEWTAFEEARWKRLEWRARQLGIRNPFTLIKN